MVAQELHLRLAARHKVRPWGGGQFKPALTPTAIAPFVPEETQSRDSRTVPDVRPMHICLLYSCPSAVDLAQQPDRAGCEILRDETVTNLARPVGAEWTCSSLMHNVAAVPKL